MITKATAHLIVTACNACQKVNPDNPQAVAESIEKMHEALKYLTDTVARVDGYTVENSESYAMALEALRSAEEKGAS